MRVHILNDYNNNELYHFYFFNILFQYWWKTSITIMAYHHFCTFLKYYFNVGGNWASKLRTEKAKATCMIFTTSPLECCLVNKNIISPIHLKAWNKVLYFFFFKFFYKNILRTLHHLVLNKLLYEPADKAKYKYVTAMQAIKKM